MLNVVAKRLLGEVSWGLKGRVILGAGLSILDMATDIFVIVGYMGKEETSRYGWSLLWMVVSSIMLQLMTVFMQSRKTPLKMFGEMLIVLTGLKPVLDGYNVISGKTMDKHSFMDAAAELTFSQCTEIVCESIPGCILQLYAMLESGEMPRRAIVSVAISALTTGFSSATMSFNFDGTTSSTTTTAHAAFANPRT